MKKFWVSISVIALFSLTSMVFWMYLTKHDSDVPVPNVTSAIPSIEVQNLGWDQTQSVEGTGLTLGSNGVPEIASEGTNSDPENATEFDVMSSVSATLVSPSVGHELSASPNGPDDDVLVLSNADAKDAPLSSNIAGFDPLADGEPSNGWVGSADEDEVPEADLENGLSEAGNVDPGTNDPAVEDTSPASNDPAVEDASPANNDPAVENASPDSKDPEVTDGATDSENDGLDGVDDDDDDDDDDSSDNSSKDSSKDKEEFRDVSDQDWAHR